MAPAIYVDRDGNLIEVAAGAIIPDGATLRVPMTFMDRAALAALHKAYPEGGAPLHDGLGHPAGFKPGYAYGGNVPFAHHQRASDARQAYVDGLRDAWKQPPAKVTPALPSNSKFPAPGPSKSSDGDDGHRAWQTYVNNLSNAWKHPGG
jgi:hypothetical protein